MNHILKKLIQQQDLTSQEAKQAMTCIMTGEAGEAKTASFLTALAIKGETGLEIEACAKAMRHACVKWPDIEQHEILIDTCGTGGDGIGTINISTLSAIVLASLGLPVAKHGNRAVSSTTGSADILESLGLKLNLNHTGVAQNLSKHKMTFLFAPQWHPAMKYAAPVRKAIGVRTVFNILGPLTNPAPITHQMVGVFNMSFMSPVAEAMATQNRKGGFVVHSQDGLDEISPEGNTHFIQINNGKVQKEGMVNPNDFGFSNMQRKDLVVADRDDSLKRMNAILDGKGNKTENATIAMNAGMLYNLVLDKKDLKGSTEVCLKSIESGSLRDFVKNWA